MKHVVHLFGAAGSGTSTLARYICDKTGWYFMDTDDYYWAPADIPYTVKRDIPDRIEMMCRDIEEHGNVVISGALSGWGDVLIPYFTLAIRVETDTSIRIERLRRREREHFGSRIDQGGDMYENHREFIEWASQYDEGGLEIRSKARHDEWEKLLKCPVVQVDGALPLEENYEIISKYCL